MPDFDFSRCERRNAVAARRDGVDSAPVRLLLHGEEFLHSSVEEFGRLPAMPRGDEALGMIHALQPQGAEKLTADDVWIHYAEAANGSFISDRYMFLSTSTLKNIAADAAGGFAFMNSHRTGGFSSDAELPLGRTFAGRYQKTRDGEERTAIGIYLLRGLKPNGAGGPSTDDLHRMIDGGTLNDVSVGLHSGEPLCDLCGKDVRETDEDGFYTCPHVPGTTLGLNKAQVERQQARGVTKGRASCSYTDGHAGETSGVYDGAITGAGFGGDYHTNTFAPLFRGSVFGSGLAKALDLSRDMGSALRADCREVFGKHKEFSEARAVSFEDQIAEALVAFEQVLNRAQEQRRLSRGRLDQLRALHARCGEFIQAAKPGADLAALRLRALRLRAAHLLDRSL